MVGAGVEPGIGKVPGRSILTNWAESCAYIQQCRRLADTDTPRTMTKLCLKWSRFAMSPGWPMGAIWRIARPRESKSPEFIEHGDIGARHLPFRHHSALRSNTLGFRSATWNRGLRLTALHAFARCDIFPILEPRVHRLTPIDLTSDFLQITSGS